MGSRKKVRPTRPPTGPALARPAAGVLLLSLGGATELGCAHSKAKPPMIEEAPMAVPVDEDPMPAPMPPPPMPDPGDPPMDEPPPDAPMTDPGDQDQVPPMPAPMPDPGS